MVTKVTDARRAKVFTDAGIRTTAHDDLQSWLRTHAVMLVPMVTAGHIARRGAAAVSRGMRLLTRALCEASAWFAELGNTITPASMVLLSRVPAPMVAGSLWAFTRFKPLVKTVGLAPDDAVVDGDTGMAEADQHIGEAGRRRAGAALGDDPLCVQRCVPTLRSNSGNGR